MIKKYSDEFWGAWVVILIVNQMFFFHCFKIHCIVAGLPHTGVLAFLYVLFIVKPKDEEEEAKRRKEEKPILRVKPIPTEEDKEEEKYPKVKPISKPKEEDNSYEKFIGKVFEKQGNLVIYNGFIRASADAGVDIIVISMDKQSIELIQCKDWTKKHIELEDLANSYKKLNHFDLRHISHRPKSILEYLQIKDSLEMIENIIDCNKENFIIRKTLYIRLDEIVNLNMSTKLKQIKPNIFRYKDMKIVKTN